MMLDRDVVAVSPSSTYRVLNAAGLLQRWNPKPSRKGNGFQQPFSAPRTLACRYLLSEHCRDLFLSLFGPGWLFAFPAPLGIADRYDRTGCRDRFAASTGKLSGQLSPRIITDNGPQFIAKDFKEFIRLAGLTHVKTSPYYPQSNGKIERWHQSLKADCLRPGCPLSQQDAARLIEHFIKHYNTVRLHSAIGYVTPADRLAGRHLEIFAERDRKLELARQNRKIKRQSLTQNTSCFD